MEATTTTTTTSNVSLITPEDVLECVMNEGTIDAIRLKIINYLKADEDLKNKTMSMVEHSKVLNTPGAEKHTKRELFDALRHELEVPALETASKSVWDLIMDNDGLGKEINQTVERVFCRLSGREPPLYTSPDIQVQQNQVTEKDNSGSDRDNEHLGSLSKKRNFSVISTQVEDAVGSCDPLPMSVDSVPSSKTVAPNRGKSMANRGKSMGAEPNRCHRTDGRSWRCSKDSLPNQRFCERHCKNKKSKKQLEGNSSNNVVDSNPNISSSKASQLVTSKKNRRSNSKRQSNLRPEASKGESSL